MGTELARRGLPAGARGWTASALRDAPALVRAIHVESLRAGAQVLTTNTFALAEPDADAVRRAVALAREAIEEVGESRVAIAGSIGPHAEAPGVLAAQLAEAGVDVVFLEMITDPARGAAALSAARVCGRPCWISAACGPTGMLLGGADPSRLAEADLRLVGCTERDGLALALDRARFDGVAPSTGATDGASFVPDAVDPLALAAHVVALAQVRPLIVVGGCCGTPPSYVAAIAEALHPDVDARDAAFATLARLTRRDREGA